jgi:hypothetical protein
MLFHGLRMLPSFHGSICYMSMSESHDVCHEVNDGLVQIRSGLMEFFSECGDIATVRIPTDRETGQIKGWAILSCCHLSWSGR